MIVGVMVLMTVDSNAMQLGDNSVLVLYRLSGSGYQDNGDTSLCADSPKLSDHSNAASYRFLNRKQTPASKEEKEFPISPDFVCHCFS